MAGHASPLFGWSRNRGKTCPSIQEPLFRGALRGAEIAGAAASFQAPTPCAKTEAGGRMTCRRLAFHFQKLDF
jgi:hypothetical protein